MKTVAISTWVGDLSLNYGSALQTTAMQKLLRDCGCEPVTIRNHFSSSWKKDRMRGWFDRDDTRYIKTKRLFDRWYRKNVKLSKVCYRDDDVVRYVLQNKIDFLLCGSDAIWKKLWIRPLFLWDYKELSEKPAIAYAVSIQKGDFEYGNAEDSLKRFVAISGRERIVAEKVEPYTDKKVDTVLDPTLSVEESFWEERTAPRLIEEEYICCYFLSKMEYNRITVDKVKQKYGVKRVVYINTDCIDKERGCYSDYRGEDYKGTVGLEEFLSLIKYAKAVCTDSGHGVCFSVVFRRDFFVLSRREFTANEDYRLTDWFLRLGTGNRIVVKNSDIDLMPRIAYGNVEKKLFEERKHSVSFLKHAVEMALRQSDHNENSPSQLQS